MARKGEIIELGLLPGVKRKAARSEARDERVEPRNVSACIQRNLLVDRPARHTLDPSRSVRAEEFAECTLDSVECGDDGRAVLVNHDRFPAQVVETLAHFGPLK